MSDALTKPARRPLLRRRVRRVFIELLAVACAGALAAFLLRSFVLEPITVPTNAMTPVLHAGDQVLIVKWRALVGPVDRGDIVAFRPPAGLSCGAGTSTRLVGRVIGLPGETITSARGRIYLDGRLLRETHWFNHRYGEVGTYPFVPTQIPRDDYFVMNDNRSNVCDSRIFGAVPRSSILGTVVAVTVRGGHPHVHFF